ncbi:FG-GAP repeat protein OS=Streptomyces griseorubiginosus OX=67304 GN=AQJ54_39980 PE=4 SV=1 [Streptomyces griseorubiginosus]
MGSAHYAGSATLLRGSASGLTTAGAKGYTQNTTGVPGANAESGDRFGAATHLVDVTKDGKAEVMVGAPGENSDGLLWTARGSAAGPMTSGSTATGGTGAGLKRRYADIDFGAALPGAQSTT